MKNNKPKINEYQFSYYKKNNDLICRYTVENETLDKALLQMNCKKHELIKISPCVYRCNLKEFTHVNGLYEKKYKDCFLEIFVDE